MEREVAGPTRPKPVSEHRHIGRSVPRLDIRPRGPGGVISPIEGGLIQSLSCTPKADVQTNGTQVQAADRGNCPILTFSEVRPVEMVLIDRSGAPLRGLGEAFQCPTEVVPANAVFDDAVGVRLRPCLRRRGGCF